MGSKDTTAAKRRLVLRNSEGGAREMEPARRELERRTARGLDGGSREEAVLVGIGRRERVEAAIYTFAGRPASIDLS